jgi:hypothetical protein
MQLIWTWRLWGFSLMRARYYGWRVAIHIGPLHVYAGRVMP